MNLEQLQYTIEVFEQGSIIKASENQFVSHSAISQSISSLESELGITIFNRSRSGTTCTEEGKQVLYLAYEIMNKIAELKELGQKAEHLKGEIKIAASTIFFSTFLPEAIYNFKKDFPDVQVKIKEEGTFEIIKSIKNNQFDIGLILANDEAMKELNSKITFKNLIQSKLMVCVSKLSPLSSNEVVTPKELIKQSLVVRDEELSQTFWDRLFMDYGRGNIIFKSNNHDVIKNLIANNIGTGIYTEFWIKNDPLVLNGDIVPIPYVENAGNYYEPSLIGLLPKQKHESIIVKEFIRYIQNSIKEYSRPNK